MKKVMDAHSLIQTREYLFQFIQTEVKFYLLGLHHTKYILEVFFR